MNTIVPDAHKTIRFVAAVCAAVAVAWLVVRALLAYDQRGDAREMAECPMRLRACQTATATVTEAVCAKQSAAQAAAQAAERVRRAQNQQARRIACRALDCCRSDSYYSEFEE